MSDAGGSRPRLGYVLPTYQASSGEHFAHVPRLLELLAREVDLELVIWDCRDEPHLPGVPRITRLAGTTVWQRYRELRRLVRARSRQGVRRWFVRSAPLPALAVEAGGGECVFWVCGVDRPPSSFSDRLGQAIFRLACRRVAHIATAPGMEAYNFEHYAIAPARTLLLNNDIDLSRWQPLDAPQRAAARSELGWPADRPILLYVHRLTTQRGAGYLIPVIERCRQAGQEPLVVAVGGPGDCSAALEAYAAEHPERLRLMGHLPNQELPRYYGAADLFLMPSQGEGFPRVVLEAMAAGLPMVATAVGVTERILPPELVERLVVPNGDIEAFAVRVVELLAAPELLATIRRSFLERVGDYSVERIAAQYREVLFGS